MAFALQTGQNHGLLNLTSTLFAHYPTLQIRFAMPLQPHKLPSFCPLSPEADLLTGKKILDKIFLSFVPSGFLEEDSEVFSLRSGREGFIQAAELSSDETPSSPSRGKESHRLWLW
jgi:hypothetical protein